MHSAGVHLSWRREPEDEGETLWAEDEAAAPATVVVAGVALSLVMIAVAAFLV